MATRRIRKKDVTSQEHKALALWAADCAEHVLPYFEKEHPKDKRPRKAIQECRKWARTGIFRMEDVRRTSLAAHAAARKCKNDAACFAARAAGQAMATAHAPGHAIAAAWYAEKAAMAAAAEDECKWQRKRIPKVLVAKLKR